MISQEMIEAGMDAFNANIDGAQSSDLLLEDCVFAIYTAMRQAQPPVDADEVKRLTRPIIGIENRAPQEVFDIMCDRFRSGTKETERPSLDRIELAERIADDYCGAHHDDLSRHDQVRWSIAFDAARAALSSRGTK